MLGIIFGIWILFMLLYDCNFFVKKLPCTPFSSINHPIIWITGNSELDSFPNKTGGGTLVDPYIIKDLTIDVAGGLYSAIKIINTDRYLILQNLTINGSRGYWSTQDGGIRLLRCKNVNITQCLFTNNRFSTMLSIVENCYIYNNTSHDNYSGLYTTDSNEGEVYFFNNTCYQNFEGIHADGGKFIRIFNNSVWDNDYGIYIQFGEYFEVYNNNISFCEKGIYLKSNGGNHNYKNSISSCSIGIELFESFVNIIRNNSIKYNDLGVLYNASSYNALVLNDLDNSINIEEFNSELNNQTGQFFPKISIIGDLELDTFPNKTGSGTNYDPYVIENLMIDSQKDGSPIEIHSTSRYLVLRNLIVTGAHYIYENNDGGIELYQCTNVNITQCILVRNEFGTHLNNVSDCYIFNNTAAYNWQHGIYTRGSRRVHIFENTLHNGNNGIHTDGDASFEIYNNHIYNNNVGIKLPHSNSFIISRNNITANSEMGILVYRSTTSTFSDNNITNNQIHGIYLDGCIFNNIKQNTISGSNSGVYFNNSNFNAIRDNFFSDNLVDIIEENSQKNSDTILLHPKIYLDGDAELDAFENKTGSGTSNDPYVISNLLIDSSWTGSAIEIHNIESYLILQENVLIHSGGDWEGAIKIDHCFNIVIKNTQMFQNDAGVIIDYSSNCKVQNNYFYENWGIGISLQQSNFSIVEKNQIDTCGTGINLDSASRNEISFNTISNTYFWEDQTGMYFWMSESNTVSNNYIEKTERGIYLIENSYNNEISGNTIINNSLYGIYLENSHFQSIEFNHISGSNYGIFLNSSNYNIFKGNRFSNNNINYEEFNSHDNEFIKVRNWVKILLWITFGVFGLSSIIFCTFFIPIRKKNAPKRYLQKSIKLMHQEKLTSALHYLDIVIKKEPQNEIAWNQKLSVLYSLERYTEVLICLDQALKVNPNFLISQPMQEKIDQIRIRDYIDDALKRIEE